MRAAIYTRVSGDEQAKHGTSLETQRDACLKLCQDNRHQPLYQLEDDCSGLVLERPKLDILRDLVRANKIDVIVIYCLDRLTRDPTHGVILQDELEKHSVKLEAVTEDVENSDLGRLISYIKSYAAKLEAAKIKERTMRGKRARAEKYGKMPCGGFLYGYDYSRETGRLIANGNLKTVRMLGLWVLEEGVTLNECRRRLQAAGIPAPRGGEIWSKGTVARLLRNPTFCGRTVVFRTELQGKRRVTSAPEKQVEIPDAVDKTAFTVEEWTGIQRQLERNRELSPRNQKHEYLLRGMISCEQCGSSFYGVPSHGRRLYRCSGRSSLSGKGCRNRTVGADRLEASIWDEVTRQLKNPDFLLHELRAGQDSTPTDRLEQQIKANLKQLKVLDDGETRYLRLYGAGVIPEEKLSAECARLNAQRVILRRENDELQHQIQGIMEASVNLKRVRQMCREAVANIDSFGPKEKRLTLEALGIRIIAGETIKVRGNLPAADGNIASLTSS